MVYFKYNSTGPWHAREEFDIATMVAFDCYEGQKEYQVIVADLYDFRYDLPIGTPVVTTWSRELCVVADNDLIRD